MWRRLVMSPPVWNRAHACNVLWKMHAGDLRGAARAAYDLAGWTDDSDFCDQRLAAEAIRDYALQTGDPDRAVAFMRQKFFFGERSDQEP